jgi:CBS domain-containing protein
MSFAVQSKPPGLDLANQTVTMDFTYREWFERNPEAYERLLHDAMGGDVTLFIRQDAIERAWEVVSPLLDGPGPRGSYPSERWTEYPAGSWSEAAARFIAPRKWLVEEGGFFARLGEIMTRDVYTIGPEATMAEVAKAMNQGRFGSSLVLSDSELIGIVTERDVLRAAASGVDLSTAKVMEWMTPDPVTVSLDLDTQEAAELMSARGFRHLPVMEGDKVAGIVSQRDVLSARIHAHRLGSAEPG